MAFRLASKGDLCEMKKGNGDTLIARDRSLARKLGKCWPLYLFLLPGLIWYVMFCYKPMLGLRMAFYDYNIFRGFEGSRFVGLENFKIYMTGPDFARTVKNTIMIALWQMLICFPVPVILAIMITEMKSHRKSSSDDIVPSALHLNGRRLRYGRQLPLSQYRYHQHDPGKAGF